MADRSVEIKLDTARLRRQFLLLRVEHFILIVLAALLGSFLGSLFASSFLKR